MREGLIPVILGTAVTATGMVIGGMDVKNRGISKRDTKVAIGAGLLGLGIAHIALGAIDLFQDRE
jgi:hypothetical protein